MAAIVGWDVGGAHLKAARAESGRITAVAQVACPLWQGMDRLAEAVPRAVAVVGEADCHRVTMTGELADLFATRKDGVERISGLMADALAPAATDFYAGRLGLVAPHAACRHATEIASANWHAPARLVAARYESAMFVDVGSTTTDIVPVAAHSVAAQAQTDAERLAAGELIYTGLTRTSLMAISSRVPFGGRWVPLMHEHFAAMADVHRLLGSLDETVDQHPSADGREKTAAGSRARLARMIGTDAEGARDSDWVELAAWFAEAQVRSIDDAARLVISRGALRGEWPIVGAGIGLALVERLAQRLGRRWMSFSTLIDVERASREWADRCAPAVALALLPEPAATS